MGHRWLKAVVVAGVAAGGMVLGTTASFAGTDNTGPGPDTSCSTSGPTFACHNWGGSAGQVKLGYTCPGYDLLKGTFWINAGGNLDGDFTDGSWGTLVCSSPVAYAIPIN